MSARSSLTRVRIAKRAAHRKQIKQRQLELMNARAVLYEPIAKEKLMAYFKKKSRASISSVSQFFEEVATCDDSDVDGDVEVVALRPSRLKKRVKVSQPLCRGDYPL